MASFVVAHHLDALLLALASSTDNFTVGLSVGIRRRPLPLTANLTISICNAAGAFVAAHGGVTMRQYFPAASAPLYLAAVAFGGLALVEVYSYWNEGDTDPHTKEKSTSPPTSSSYSMGNYMQVLKLAVPMTLNNLAGGVAGGAAGLSPQVSTLCAFLASFGTMFVGHHVGLQLGSALSKNRRMVHPSLLSAILLGVLCVLTLHEALWGGGSTGNGEGNTLNTNR